MTNIEQLIRNQGSMVSGELADYLQEADSISPIAARKRIERITNEEGLFWKCFFIIKLFPTIINKIA